MIHLGLADVYGLCEFLCPAIDYTLRRTIHQVTEVTTGLSHIVNKKEYIYLSCIVGKCLYNENELGYNPFCTGMYHVLCRYICVFVITQY